jgi:penicillin-binding protein 1C
VVAVWVGNFDGRGDPVFVGRTAAGPLLFELLEQLGRDRKEVYERPRPEADLNLERVAMCRETGDLPGRYCPGTAPAWFIPGVSPIRVSTVHRAIPIDNVSGKRACYHDPRTSHQEVYEFWPSDLLRIFRQAGVARRTPPPFLQTCSLEQQRSKGIAPRIISPSPFIDYTRKLNRKEPDLIPFEAVADADVKTLYWFVDNRLVGRTKASHVLLWPAETGQFTVSVMDDHGQADKLSLRVVTVQ